MQFVADARDCGFDPTELGTSEKIENGKKWATIYGDLVVTNGILFLIERWHYQIIFDTIDSNIG